MASRTIEDLLAAKHAGEHLTKIDAQRLARHERRRARLDERLFSDGMVREWWVLTEDHDVDVFELLEWWATRGLSVHTDPDELRNIARFFLSFAWEYYETFGEREGSDRLRRKRAAVYGQRGGRESGVKRREKADTKLSALQAAIARRPGARQKGAAITVAHENPQWFTDREKGNRPEALLKSIRRTRARKNTGHKG